MKYKIGVFGSAAGNYELAIPKAREVGEILGNHSDKVIVVTGACAGLPYIAAKAAADKGAEVWGYASSLTYDALKKEYPDDDLSIYDKIFYVAEEFPLSKIDRSNKKYRNVLSTGNCDAGIIISGLWGTLNEFTNLIDQQKIVGVLTGTGNVAAELPRLTQKIHKAGQGEVIFRDSPSELIDQILKRL